MKKRQPPRRRRTREKKISKRLDILRRASEAFRRNGIEQTSMQDIADSVGLTAGSLYYYFKSKPEIVYSSQRMAIDRLLAEAVRQQRRRMRPDTRLFLLLNSHVRCLLGEPSVSSLPVGALEMLTTRHRRQLLERRTRYRQILERAIRNGVAKRLFLKCDPEQRAALIMHLVDSLGQSAQTAGAIRQEDLAREIAVYLVRGLMRSGVAIRLEPPAPRRRPTAAVATRRRATRRRSPAAARTPRG